jgi:hypothetical protein
VQQKKMVMRTDVLRSAARRLPPPPAALVAAVEQQLKTVQQLSSWDATSAVGSRPASPLGALNHSGGGSPTGTTGTTRTTHLPSALKVAPTTASPTHGPATARRGVSILSATNTSVHNGGHDGTSNLNAAMQSLAHQMKLAPCEDFRAFMQDAFGPSAAAAGAFALGEMAGRSIALGATGGVGGHAGRHPHSNGPTSGGGIPLYAAELIAQIAGALDHGPLHGDPNDPAVAAASAALVARRLDAPAFPIAVTQESILEDASLVAVASYYRT